MYPLPPGRAITYIMSGHGSATLTGKQSDFSYQFSTSQDGNLVFVVCDKTYLGYIRHAHTGLIVGRMGQPNHPAFAALRWYMHQALNNPEIASQAEFTHHGACGKCAEPLTTEIDQKRGHHGGCIMQRELAL